MTLENQPGQPSVTGPPTFIDPTAGIAPQPPSAPTRPSPATSTPVSSSPANPSSAILPTPASSSRPSNGLRLGLVGALVAVAGLGGFAVKTALTEPAGPQSPEAAVDAFFVALDNEDLIGMAETLLPSERESLIDPSLAIVEEIERLEIFGAGIEIDTMGTFEVVVTGVVAESKPLADGFAMVSADTGTVAITGGSDDLPVVASFLELTNQDPEAAITETADLAQDPFEMVAVEHDGSWYLSLAYSAAEAIRSDHTAPLPIFGSGPIPVGGSSPEAAIENLMNEMVQGDLEGMLTQLDPEEMRALYDYSPLFVPDAQEMIDTGLAGFRAEGAEWSITNIALHSEERNGRTVVVLDAMDLEFSMPGTQASASFADGCTTIQASGDAFGDVDETLCQDDPPSGYDFDYMAELGLSHIEVPEFGTTVVERDGSWYVSVVPTALYSGIDLLRVLEPGDIEAIKNNLDGLQEVLDSAMSTVDPIGIGGPAQFEPVGEAISLDKTAFGDADFNIVEVDLSYLPEGVMAFPMDTKRWWQMEHHQLAEPVGLFIADKDGSLVTVAEYSSIEESQAAMSQLLTFDYEGDLDAATDSWTLVRRAGRFLVFGGLEDDTAGITVFDQMVDHLAGF